MGLWIQKIIAKFLGKQPEVVAEPEALELPDFEAMSKVQLDAWADLNLGLKLDRRKKKNIMIQEIQNHLNKEN